MNKRIVAMILAVMMLMSMMTVGVFAEDEKVQIEFCVGDEILTINGEEVKVEKPYVVGAGVTLVPVRVITEAFGAKVDWIADTKTVKLSYPDVDITLQIGNPIAEVNGKAETLLAAPELPKSTTMVPLRFISENFGADVVYDSATEKITVTKDMSSSADSTVEGSADSKYVGDSYYGWSMNNPKDAVMNYRSFDGLYTSFDYDDNSWVEIIIYTIDEEYNFDKHFESGKATSDGMTLVKADKDTSNANEKKMHFQKKNKDVFYDEYFIVTDKYYYYVFGAFQNSDEKMKNEILKVLESFSLKYSDTDTYDLSNVKDGMRKFEAEVANLSFDVPQDFCIISSEDSLNSFSFVSGENNSDAGVNFVVYSKESVKSAETMAKHDYEGNKRITNESLSKFSDGVVKKIYSTVSGYEYTYEFTTTDRDLVVTDFFFELGDYVYNMSVSVDRTNINRDELTRKILNSIKVEEIDASEMGTLLRSEREGEGTTLCDDITRCEFSVSNLFEEVASSSNSVAYFYDLTQTAITVSCDMSADYTYDTVKEVAKSVVNGYKKMENTTIIKGVSNFNIAYKTGLFFELKYTQDEETVYVQQYIATHNGILYTWTIMYPELGYSEYAKSLVNDMISSVKFK